MFMVLDAQMAKSEIPSIVVQTGCTGNDLRSNGSLEMEGPHRQLSRPSRLAKQEEIEIEEDCNFATSPPTIHIEDDGSCKDDEDGATASFQSESSALCRQDSLSTPGDTGTISPDGIRKAELLNSRSGQRLKLLVRSQAVHDDTSPPPPEPETLTTNTNTLTVTNVSSLSLQSHSQAKGSNRLLIGKQGSSQGTGSIEGSSPSLSRDSSTETYTDSTGVDLQQFIVDTLHKSQKDRMMLFKIEQDLVTLVKDNKTQTFRFSPMSSYNRMLVHRVAAFFGLEHNVDKNGTSVIVNKTKNTRIPDIRFQDQIRRGELVPDEPKKLILKRDSASFEEGKESPERQSSMDSKRSKSFEEREEEYEKARARIFNQDSLDMLLEGYAESPYSRSQDETLSSRRSSQDDLRWVGEPRPWSSTDSDSSGRKAGSFDCEGGGSKLAHKEKQGQSKSDSEGAKESLMPNYGAKPTVTKASSFGGISLLVSTSSTKPTSRLTKSESLNATSNVTMVTNVPSTAASSIGPSGSSSLPSPTKTAVTKVETPSESTSQKPEGNIVPTSENTSANAPLSPRPIKATSPQISSQTAKWDSNTKEKEPAPKKLDRQWSGEHKHPGSTNSNPAPYYGSEKMSNNMSQNYANAQSVASHHSHHIHVLSNSGQTSHSPHMNTPSPVVPQMPPPQQSHSPAYPPANQTVLYIPYPGVLNHQQQQQQNSLGLPPPPHTPHPMTPIMAGPGGGQEARHLGQDGNVVDLTNQMATMSFGPGPGHGGSGVPNHNGPGNHSQQGNSLAIEYAKTTSASSATTQSYFVPSDKGQGFSGHQPSTQLYYVQHFPPPVNMRYICPTPTVPPIKGADGMNDCGPPQSPSPHLSGQQLLPAGYQIVTFSQNSDNLGYSTAPYNYLYVNPGTTTPSNNLAPPPPGANSNPNSLPIYPYGNTIHLYGSASGGNSLVGPQNSSQLAPPQGGAQFGHHPPGPVPVCVLPNGTNNSAIHGPPPSVALGGSHHFGGPVPFRPQTPPTQNANSMGGGALGHGPRGPMQNANNQSQLTTPYVGYAFFTPPMHHQNHHPQNVSSAGAHHVNTLTQSHIGQPNPAPHQRGPGSSASLQSSTVHQPFMTAFQVLRPAGIPMSNVVRNSTPPPPPPSHPNVNQQNIIPIQLPTPPPPPPQQQPPNHGKGSGQYQYPMNKMGGEQQNQPHQHHHHHHPDANHYKGGNNNPKMNRMSGPLHVGPTQFRMTGPVYRGRPLSLMQDVRLVGHPLQQQLNPLLFPPQHQPRGRFPPPQMNTPFGQPNFMGRGPKSRKQRARWITPLPGQNTSAGSNSKGHSNILNPDDIYTKGNQMFLVEGIPDNMKRVDLERYLEPVTNLGAKVQLYSMDGNNGGGGGINGNLPAEFTVNLSKFQVYAVFDNETAAQTALLNVKTPKFQLRLPPTITTSSNSSQHQQPPPPPPNYHHRQQHAMVQTHPRAGGGGGNGGAGGPPIHPLPSHHHHHHHHNNRYHQQHHKEGPQTGGNKSIS